MALSIKDPEADRLARALAEATGESLTDAVKAALREKLEKERRKALGTQDELVARLHSRVARWAEISDADPRSPDEIIGYNESGHFD